VSSLDHTDKPELIENLRLWNRELEANGYRPLVITAAAERMDVVELRRIVKATARHLADLIDAGEVVWGET
jgi:hypothetical protein